MAKQKPEALRELSTDERFRLTFKRATEAVTNPLQFRAQRREIARIKTILRERERKPA